MSGVLDSHEIQGSAPLLLSLHAQAQLGMAKDLFHGTCSIRLPSGPQKALEIRLFRTSDSGLLRINLTEGLEQGRQPRLIRAFMIPPPPASLNVRVPSAADTGGPDCNAARGDAFTDAGARDSHADDMSGKRKATAIDDIQDKSLDLGLTAAETLNPKP